jgi:proteasome lid subunit RPN8/RPN11
MGKLLGIILPSIADIQCGLNRAWPLEWPLINSGRETRRRLVVVTVVQIRVK